ncbi:GlsB/YeaQ/YmgE family stress response membrane protein [Chitinophaga sedimenti]|uniref:GlsB/YeaQ/YmgE family stress response membrane protein n=1 Tax=Chitinophaga sedimenti TaxID=2033606 RepID=UPI0020037D1B|nr:GlsB/YeaQ/YmgE family stress response membrane protein [Chitinophaga sedimenti]MCK7558520.1 GlsB/YeaQ/YmgE family stress response membrane protein [Chitinophaga sedimenti]
MHWLWFILIGAAAGWLAGLIVKGQGMGCLGNILLGIVGGVLGGWIFRQLHLAPAGTFVTAFAGAFVILMIANLISRK